MIELRTSWLRRPRTSTPAAGHPPFIRLLLNVASLSLLITAPFAAEAQQAVDGLAPSPGANQLTIEVVGGTPPAPVPQARVRGVYRAILRGQTDFDLKTNDEGKLSLERLPHRLVVCASNGDGTQAAMIEIGPDDKEVRIALKPTRTVTGKVIDRGTGAPQIDEQIRYGRDVRLGDSEDSFPKRSFGGVVSTDREGRFRITGLVIGETYQISGRFKADAETPIEMESALAMTRSDDSSPTIDLGILHRGRLVKSSAYDRLIQASFSSTQPVDERFREHQAEARIGKVRMLVLFGSPKDGTTRSFFEALYATPESRDLYEGFLLTSISTTGPKEAQTRAFAAKEKFTLPEGDGLRLVILDDEGRRLADVDEKVLSTDGALDQTKVLALLKQHAPQRLDARQLMDEALAQARRENKRVFVAEGATWCGPCWQLNRFIDRHQGIFDKDYIFVKLDRRWSQTRDIMDELRTDGSMGIPWYAILDADGKTLTTSSLEGENIGFPAEAVGYDHFLSMLTQTRQRMTEADLAAIKAALEAKR